MDKIFTTELNETVVKPRFCEIDSLLIVHHSRFIPWMEESNFSFVERVLNIPRKHLFEMEIYNPVQSLECTYKNHITWDDEVLIKTTMEYSQFASFTMHNVLCCKKNPAKIFARAKVRLLITNKELKMKLLAPEFLITRIREAEAKYPAYFKNRDNA